MKTGQFVNPFTRSGYWYKANLHTHTTTSDGSLSPADRVRQYRRAGYDVLALTDHLATNDVRGMSDGKMLVISGAEYHPPCPTSDNLYHFVALNLPHPFKLDDSGGADHCIRRIAKAGGLTILAHPYWCGQSFADFRNLKGLAAMEVYNSTCARMGRASSENEWSYALAHDMPLPIIGVDDTHLVDSGDVFECWTWLKMPSPTIANVLTAVRTGACYASCGPTIHDFRVEGGKVTLRCSPVSTIHFIGQAPRGDRRRAEKGKTVKTFTIPKPNWPYVRAVVTAPDGSKAWTNPIFL